MTDTSGTPAQYQQFGGQSEKFASMHRRSDWCVPTSVLNVLWEDLMPRLAARLWEGHTFLSDATTSDLRDGQPVEFTEADLKELTRVLKTLAFGEAAARDPEAYRDAVKTMDDAVAHRQGLRGSTFQRHCRIAIDYLDEPAQRVPIYMQVDNGYDFVLHGRGVHIFIPNDPFVDANGQQSAGALHRGLVRMMELYKYRQTGSPPIGLPGGFGLLPTGSGFTYQVPLPQISTPTGPSRVHDNWLQWFEEETGGATDQDWWTTGVVYRSIMNLFPRLIASIWLEGLNSNGNGGFYRERFESSDGLKALVADRLETHFDDAMALRVWDHLEIPQRAHGWCDSEIVVTNKGFFVPKVADPPPVDRILRSIVYGYAGNPIFTNTGQTGGD